MREYTIPPTQKAWQILLPWLLAMIHCDIAGIQTYKHCCMIEQILATIFRFVDWLLVNQNMGLASALEPVLA